MFPLQNANFEKYIAVFAALSVCTMRLMTASGQIAAGVALLLGMAAWHYNKNGVWLSEEVKGYMKAYGVFVLLTVPSVFLSDKPGESVKDILDYWVWRYVLFAVIAACIHRREYLVNMLTAYLAMASVEFLYTLVQVLKHVSNDGRGWGFATGLSISGIMCMLLPVALVILMDPGFEKKLKRVSAFSVISILVGLLCNKSRGAWLTELIVVPLATFRYLKQNKKYLAVVLAVFLGIAGFMASNTRYMARVKSITNTTTDLSNIGRIQVWKSAMNIIRDHPITGVGVGRFTEVNHNISNQNNKIIANQIRKKVVNQNNKKIANQNSKKVSNQNNKKIANQKNRKTANQKNKNRSIIISHSHNNFIQITAECGFLGLAGLLYFIGYYLRSSLRSYRNNHNPYDILIFTICFGFICLYGLIDYSLGFATGIRAMWFLLAVLLKLKETSIYQVQRS